jgi:hypothetical protein
MAAGKLDFFNSLSSSASLAVKRAGIPRVEASAMVKQSAREIACWHLILLAAERSEETHAMSHAFDASKSVIFVSATVAPSVLQMMYCASVIASSDAHGSTFPEAISLNNRVFVPLTSNSINTPASHATLVNGYLLVVVFPLTD